MCRASAVPLRSLCVCVCVCVCVCLSSRPRRRHIRADRLVQQHADAEARYAAIRRGEHLEEARYKHALHTARLMCRAFKAASYVRGKSSFRDLFALYDQNNDGFLDSKEWLHLGESSCLIGWVYSDGRVCPFVIYLCVALVSLV